jgi:hypothetical protein
LIEIAALKGWDLVFWDRQSPMMTPVELNEKGFQALVNALGYEDTIRFLKLYDHGK